jgi:UDP-glucose 4-epimerase
MFNPMKVLVTGGAGFIGSHLVEDLVKRDACVTVVDNLATGDRANLTAVSSRIEFQVMDVAGSDFGTLLAKQNFDAIFHLAANAYVPPSVNDPSFDYHSNLEASFRMFEVLRRVHYPGKLINFSSAAVYGEPSRLPIRETDPVIPISPYGVSKLAIERYAHVYARLYGLRVASLRLFSVFGPGQRKQVVYDLINKLAHNPNLVEILGDGSQTRDLNYVTDVVQAALKVAENAPLVGETYNTASGCSYSIRDLIQVLCEVMNVQPVLNFSGHVRPGDPNRWECDITCLQQLDYEPQVSLKEGIRRTVDWFMAAGARHGNPVVDPMGEVRD